MRKILVVLFPLLLAGCASVNSYQEPPSGSRPLATVSGSSSRSSLFDWSSYLVSQIDDKTVSMVWDENSKINVIPGYHAFIIASSFNRGYGIGPYEGLTEVKMTVSAGKHYRFTGKMSGTLIKVWAVDDAGNRVSPISSSSYQLAPSD